MAPLLLIIVFFGVITFIGMAVVTHITDYNRKKAKEFLRGLRDARQRLGLANSALRAIVNGAGNPVLEAQIALDNQEQLDYKELN